MRYIAKSSPHGCPARRVARYPAPISAMKTPIATRCRGSGGRPSPAGINLVNRVCVDLLVVLFERLVHVAIECRIDSCKPPESLSISGLFHHDVCCPFSGEITQRA